MKSVSYWASQHLWTARLLLVAGHFILALLAVFVGKSLAHLNLSLPFYLIYLLILPFASAWLMHPGGHSSNTYLRRKWCEGTAGAIGFLMVVCLAGQRLPARGGPAPAWSNTALEYSIKSKEAKQPAFDKKPLLQKKNLRQQYREKVRTLKQMYRQGPLFTKIALTLLALVVAFGLLFVLTILSCYISCDIALALGIIVAIVGTGAVVFFFIRTIRSIQRKYRRDIQKEAPRIKPVPDS